MELESLYYFSELAKDLHFRNTADRLFISHQTLSNHIKRLESHYGILLFDRTPKLTLTYAGEKLLEYAQGLIQKDALLQSYFSDIQGEEMGIIRMGASRLRLSGCIPDVLPVFSARYPLVETRLTDKNSAELLSLLLDDKLDFALSTVWPEGANLETAILLNDQTYLCVSQQLLEQYCNIDLETEKSLIITEDTLPLISQLPLFFLNTTLGHQVQKLFTRAGVTPKIASSISYTQLVVDLTYKGLAASFIPATAIADTRIPVPPNIRFFPVCKGGTPLYQSLNLITRTDKYYPSYTRFFIKLIQDYYRKEMSDMENRF